MSELISSTTRLLEFKGHETKVPAVAVFPDGRRMVTGSYDKTLRLWDLNTGVMLKKMEGHRKAVLTTALSRDGQFIASSDDEGVLIAWNGETGESLTQPMKAHFRPLSSLDFSPDGSILASGSWDFTTKFWSTKTWEQQGSAIEVDGSYIHCIRYSPSGELLAIATSDKITIYNLSTRECHILQGSQEMELLTHVDARWHAYKLNLPGGIIKSRRFCEIVRNAGYRWAWSDTCCIDKGSNVELQQSLNSMFVWYQHSALTIVYLSDVLPSSKPGALGMSEWNRRGWTFQEFLASKVVIFYQKDWTPYLNDRSPNHKKSTAIMKELEVATGIDRQALIDFSPGMSGARERLQWASNRVTTVQEDIAYSLFGVFDVRLPVDYGEKKANALGRLLQEIVARSGDITALYWVGQSSEFNSCLPADITSYAAPPRSLPSLSEDDIQTEVSSLQRNTVAVNLASKLYALLQSMSAPRFANRRLHLPCISFRVTEIRQKRGPAQATHFIYGVKADGLQDLLITTGETLIQFSRARPTRQTFFLVRPWDRCLLERLDFADDVGSAGDLSEHGSQSDGSEEFPDGPPVEEERHLRALRMMVHLGQPFGAFLLAQQRVGEYKRIASDYNIIAQVKNMASVDSMDVSSIEIL